MPFPNEIPNPVAPIQEGLGRIATLIEALNPANWPTLLESGMTSSYALLIDQLLADRSTIFDSEVFKSLALLFASLGLIPWVVGTLYHVGKAGDGEKGHGRLWLQETAWVMSLAPSLAVVTTFLQSTTTLFARYVIMQILGANSPKEALLRLVTTDGLNPFEKGLFVIACYLLIIVIALELTATVLALPIAALAMIFAVPLRWAGDTADAFFRSSIGAYVVGIGGPIAVALWFALVIVLTGPAYGDNPRSRSLVGVVALGGAVLAIWPLRNQWNTHVKPRLHMPGARVDADGGEMHSDSATVDTAIVNSARLSEFESDVRTVADSIPGMDPAQEARVADDALQAIGDMDAQSAASQPGSDVTGTTSQPTHGAVDGLAEYGSDVTKPSTGEAPDVSQQGVTWPEAETNHEELYALPVGPSTTTSQSIVPPPRPNEDVGDDPDNPDNPRKEV